MPASDEILMISPIPLARRWKTTINKHILCSYYFISVINIWSFVTIPFNHARENQSGHLREDNINNFFFFHEGKKTKLCSDTVEKVTEQIRNVNIQRSLT